MGKGTELEDWFVKISALRYNFGFLGHINVRWTRECQLFLNQDEFWHMDSFEYISKVSICALINRILS